MNQKLKKMLGAMDDMAQERWKNEKCQVQMQRNERCFDEMGGHLPR